jgi:predicted phosphate transport protein (TIGR00153 family)
MLERFFPRETPFFDLFERHAARIVAAAKAFLALAQNGDEFEKRAREIKQIESEADSITHQCVEALYRTSRTPFGRDEVYKLITRMDDIVDAIEAAADCFMLYDIDRTTPESRELATVLVKATEQIEVALRGLRYVRGDRGVLERCIEINRLENESDAILGAALAKLFRTEKDPITLIKWKEIYELLESATDRCEDVANIIESIILQKA